MELKDLVEIIPELLLLVVPGYIAIKIKETYRLEKKNEHFDVILCSILYSFVIGIIYSAVVFVSNHVNVRVAEFLKDTTVKQFSYFFLAVVLGLILTKLPSSKVGKLVDKIFNKNLSSEPSVWIKAMTNPSGAWATAYLENGLIYTGMLIDYTTDPNHDCKEILLSHYRLSVRNDKSPEVADDFCFIIEDHTDEPNAKVLLSRDTIVAIEIQK